MQETSPQPQLGPIRVAAAKVQVSASFSHTLLCFIFDVQHPFIALIFLISLWHSSSSVPPQHEASSYGPDVLMAPHVSLASPIATHGQACARHFDELCALFDDEERQFIYEISQLQVGDSYGQFKIWASNIGALQPIQSASSLDYRLREVPKVSKQVVALLQDLNDALEDGMHWPIPLPQAMVVLVDLILMPLSYRNCLWGEGKPGQLSRTNQC
jgi:hypothetical protein